MTPPASRQSPHILRKGRRRMLVEVELENRKENAYNASLWLHLPGNLHFSSFVLQVQPRGGPKSLRSPSKLSQQGKDGDPGLWRTSRSFLSQPIPGGMGWSALGPQNHFKWDSGVRCVPNVSQVGARGPLCPQPIPWGTWGSIVSPPPPRQEIRFHWSAVASQYPPVGVYCCHLPVPQVPQLHVLAPIVSPWQDPSTVKLECSALGGHRQRCSVGYPVFRSQAKVGPLRPP